MEERKYFMGDIYNGIVTKGVFRILFLKALEKNNVIVIKDEINQQFIFRGEKLDFLDNFWFKNLVYWEDVVDYN